MFLTPADVNAYIFPQWRQRLGTLGGDLSITRAKVAEEVARNCGGWYSPLEFLKVLDVVGQYWLACLPISWPGWWALFLKNKTGTRRCATTTGGIHFSATLGKSIPPTMTFFSGNLWLNRLWKKIISKDGLRGGYQCDWVCARHYHTLSSLWNIFPTLIVRRFPNNKTR